MVSLNSFKSPKKKLVADIYFSGNKFSQEENIPEEAVSVVRQELMEQELEVQIHQGVPSLSSKEVANLSIWQKKVRPRQEANQRQQFEANKVVEESTVDSEKILGHQDEIEVKRVTKFRKPPFKLVKLNKLSVGVILVVIGAVAFYSLSHFVFAKAEIVITTTKTNLVLEDKVLIDTNINTPNLNTGVLPGSFFVFKESAEKQFPSTGKATEAQKAKGEVILINNYSTTPQMLVATTRLETPDGKIFRLDSQTIIPGAGLENGKLVSSKITVKVTADQPGSEYNINPCQLPNCKFTIVGFKGTPKYEGFYGISEKPMSGGSSEVVRMVTAEDISQATTEISQILSDKLNKTAEEKFKNLTGAPLIVKGAKATPVIKNLDSDAKVGDFREYFTVKASGEMSVIAFNEEQLIEYVQHKLINQKKENFEFYQKPVIEIINSQPDFVKKTLTLSFKATQEVRYKVSSAEILAKARGVNQKKLEQIFIDTPGISKVHIKLIPYWLNTIPTDVSKINVIID